MLKQSFNLKLQQKLSPQQIQLMKLLQVPTAELEQRVKQEIEENPALEEGEEGDSEDSAEEVVESIETENTEEGGENDDIDLSDYFQDDDGVPEYKTQVNNQSRDEEERDMPLAFP